MSYLGQSPRASREVKQTFSPWLREIFVSLGASLGSKYLSTIVEEVLGDYEHDITACVFLITSSKVSTLVL